MRLYDKYRPRTLSDIVGQPVIRTLQVFAREPYQRSFLLEGPKGTGKTSAAFALATEMGCHDDDVILRMGSELSVDELRYLWNGHLRYRPRNVGTLKLLILEEFESLSPQAQVFLKTGLDREFPPSTAVVATSNDTSKINKIVLERFKRLTFTAGASFAKAAAARLAQIWAWETANMGSQPLPSGYANWGWDVEEYSLRRALDAMQDALEECEVLA